MDDSLANEVVVKGGYVLVLNRRVPDVARVAAICAAIDEALQAHGLSRVLFDTRPSRRPRKCARRCGPG